MKLYTKSNNDLNKYFIRSILFLQIVVIAFVSSDKALSQTIKHPVSEITSTAQHYIYEYFLSDTEKKDIKYFLVLDDNGNVKSAFDACDVCYREYKGYSQNDEYMRCNNCGNQYKINDLGSQGQGGCWPGYLKHKIEDDQVFIEVSDLILKANYFETQIVSDVITESKDEIILEQNDSELWINFQTNNKKSIKIVDIKGNIVFESPCYSNIIIQTNRLPSGNYIMLLQNSHEVKSIKFVLSK